MENGLALGGSGRHGLWGYSRHDNRAKKGHNNQPCSYGEGEGSSQNVVFVSLSLLLFFSHFSSDASLRSTWAPRLPVPFPSCGKCLEVPASAVIPIPAASFDIGSKRSSFRLLAVSNAAAARSFFFPLPVPVIVATGTEIRTPIRTAIGRWRTSRRACDARMQCL